MQVRVVVRAGITGGWRGGVVAALLSPGSGFGLGTVEVMMIVPVKRLPRRSCGGEVRVGVENGRRVAHAGVG